MAQNDETTGASVRDGQRAGGAGRAARDDSERGRAVAYLDLWERQVSLTAVQHRFPPFAVRRDPWKPR